MPSPTAVTFATPQVIVINPDGGAYLRPDYLPAVQDEGETFFRTIGVNEVLVIGKAQGQPYNEDPDWYLTRFPNGEERFIHQNDLAPFDDTNLKIIPILKVPVEESLTLYRQPSSILVGDLVQMNPSEQVEAYYLRVLTRPSISNAGEAWVKILWLGEPRWLIADLNNLSVKYETVEIEVVQPNNSNARASNPNRVLAHLNRPTNIPFYLTIDQRVLVRYRATYRDVDWYYIQTSDNAGWVEAIAIVLDSGLTVDQIVPVRLATQINDELIIRRTPNTASEIPRRVPQSANELFVIIAMVEGGFVTPIGGGEPNNIWYQLLDGNYIHSGLVTIVSE